MTGGSDWLFLGFRALKIWLPDDWFAAGSFEWIASVDGYEPPGWIERWDFNYSGCRNSEDAAWAAVPEAERAEYQMYAHRLLPVYFRGEERPVLQTLDRLFDLGIEDTLPAEPELSRYRMLGFDVVGRGFHESLGLGPTLGFGTSPLSTCGMFKETAVNRYCLIDRLEDAVAFARQCNVELPEPENYYVVQVLYRQG